MAENSRPTLASRLRAAASDFVQQHETRARPLAEKARERDWSVFVFGGVPRGLAESGGRYIPRDLDLVFDDAAFECFASEFASSITRRTRFGGLHLCLNGLQVDAWPLSATWAFREKLVAQASFSNLPKTTFLNCDGIVLQFATRRGQARAVYAQGLEKAEKRGALDIELRANPFPALCVVRSLRMASNRLLPLAPQLAEYCWRELAAHDLADFVDVQSSHYGSVSFTESSLRRIRARLERHLDRMPLFDFHVTRQQQLWEDEQAAFGE